MTAVQTDSSAAIRGGFIDPVFEAQSVFRQVMNAMARPGFLQQIDTTVAPPPPLSKVAGALAATLFDHDTAIWLGPVLCREDRVRNWLAFHTSAPLTEHALDAHFALLVDAKSITSFESFSLGTQEYPDRSTTVIVQLEDLEGGEPLRLTGPGIKDSITIAPKGLPETFSTLWASNRSRFPRGVDLILAGPDAVIGLPRTVNLEIRPAGQGGH